ncbi:MAG: SMP-30/gluconolactonase/LRE family protein [Candidatus Aminicenantes bacterium]|nr:SMP-30/gluconolactonase/LRE family protein [Candidatus Aminicenantes bacterium]
MNRKNIIGILVCFLFISSVFAQEEVINFDSERWTLYSAQIVDYLDQKALRGAAILKDVMFENGVIEFDIAFQGNRCFAGLMFRMTSESDYEEIYLRPHQTNNPDALQYTPVFNGISGWQLYNGPGFTNAVSIPYQEWIHVKMEISGTQARVYVGQSQRPALVINDLKHGKSRGWIGVKGPNNGLAHFSNFTFRHDANLKFDPPPPAQIPSGLLLDWELSEPTKITQIDRESFPSENQMKALKWKKIEGEANGLVDIARTYAKQGADPDCVLARTSIQSDNDQVKKLIFGYSDEVSIFLNEKILFRGHSEYLSRSARFLGVVGLYDSVFLPLKQGQNELLFMVTENFGGWGFICRLTETGDKPLLYASSLTKEWETPAQFLTPESVLYDKKRDVLYVSNYNNLTSGEEADDFISRVSTKGEIDQLHWVSGLHDPTGMGILGDKLYVAENSSLVEIDITKGTILQRYQAPGAKFLNDVAIDSSGEIYITDSLAHSIYKFSSGTFEVWLKGEEINRPNGLLLDSGKLLYGNTGDASLKAVRLADKKIDTVTQFSQGAIIDGIKTDGSGNYLVSDWNGWLYLVSPSGGKKEFLNTRAAGINIADFEFNKELGLLVIPTFSGNRLLTFRTIFQ